MNVTQIRQILKEYDDNLVQIVDNLSDKYFIRKSFVELFRSNSYRYSEIISDGEFKTRNNVYDEFFITLNSLNSLSIDEVFLNLRFFITDYNDRSVNECLYEPLSKFNYSKFRNSLSFIKEKISNDFVKINHFLVFVFSLNIIERTDPQVIIIQYRFLIGDYLF